jgi:hypothetical protein
VVPGATEEIVVRKTEEAKAKAKAKAKVKFEVT